MKSHATTVGLAVETQGYSRHKSNSKKKKQNKKTISHITEKSSGMAVSRQSGVCPPFLGALSFVTVLLPGKLPLLDVRWPKELSVYPKPTQQPLQKPKIVGPTWDYVTISPTL